MHDPSGNSGALPDQTEGRDQDSASFLNDGAGADWTIEESASGAFGGSVTRSGPLSATGAADGSRPLAAARPTGDRVRSFPWKRVGILVILVALLLGVGSLALANTMTRSASSLAPTAPRTTRQALPAQKTPPVPTAAPAFDWVAAPLPAGWLASGRNAADGVEAKRVGMTFTDREMSLDFRDAGTAAQPAGTFTAATFLLTAGGRQRFNQNDVRVASPALFNSVQQHQLIQEVINGQPTLVQVQTQGQQQFAWVAVAFQLFQSQLNNAGQRVEGKEVTAMGQPVTHHMVVLLLRVPPEQQGPNAPMGGTGWLVSNYILDGTTLPAITQPV